MICDGVLRGETVTDTLLYTNINHIIKYFFIIRVIRSLFIRDDKCKDSISVI